MILGAIRVIVDQIDIFRPTRCRNWKSGFLRRQWLVLLPAMPEWRKESVAQRPAPMRRQIYAERRSRATEVHGLVAAGRNIVAFIA